jgi:hypothetical protein
VIWVSRSTSSYWLSCVRTFLSMTVAIALCGVHVLFILQLTSALTLLKNSSTTSCDMNLVLWLRASSSNCLVASQPSYSRQSLNCVGIMRCHMERF